MNEAHTTPAAVTPRNRLIMDTADAMDCTHGHAGWGYRCWDCIDEAEAAVPVRVSREDFAVGYRAMRVALARTGMSDTRADWDADWAHVADVAARHPLAGMVADTTGAVDPLVEASRTRAARARAIRTADVPF